MKSKKFTETWIKEQKHSIPTDYKSVDCDYRGRVLAAVHGFYAGRQRGRKPSPPQRIERGNTYITNTSNLPVGVNP